MIECVAHEVDEWVTHQFDHDSINFSLLSPNDKRHLLVQRVREIAYQAWESAEYGVYRDHTRSQYRGLKFLGNETKTCCRMSERRVHRIRLRTHFLCQLHESIPFLHQLANQIDEVIQLANVNTHAGGGGPWVCGCGGCSG